MTTTKWTSNYLQNITQDVIITIEQHKKPEMNSGAPEG